MNFPDLIDRGERRFISIDRATVEILREIGSPRRVPKGQISVQAALLSWAEFRTQGVLRYQIREMNRIMEEIAASRKGPGNLWFPASYKDIRRETFDLYGKNSIPRGLGYLDEIGLLERRAPERAHEGVPSSYRLRVDRIVRLYDGLHNGRDLTALLEDPGPGETIPEPGPPVPGTGETIPEMGQGVPVKGEGVPGAGENDRVLGGSPDPDLGESVPGPGEVVVPFRARSLTGQGQTGPGPGIPLYGEERKEPENNSTETERLCGLFSGFNGKGSDQDDLKAAARLLERFPFDVIAEVIEFSQTHYFWRTRSVSVSKLERHIESILPQMASVDPMDAEL